MELHTRGQSAAQTAGEVGEHVFARGLVIDQHHPVEPQPQRGEQRLIGGRAAQDSSVVEARYDLLVPVPL